MLPLSPKLSQRRSAPNYSVCSSDEIRAFDQKTIKSGVSEESLIKRAARALFHEFTKSFPGQKGLVALLIGPGNNGADVMEMGVHLRDSGYRTVEFKSNKFGPDDEQGLIRALGSAEFIIDGLLGTGASGEPRGAIKKIIEIVNGSDFPGRVVAIDLPSGVDADTGQAQIYLKATLTLTIQCLKRGMTQYPGRAICGDIKIVDIGIDTSESEYQLLTHDNVPTLKQRDPKSHKGNFGYVLVIGGSRNMPGAPILAAEAALRTGAGLVRVASGSDFPVASAPELMFLRTPQEGHSKKSLKQIIAFLEDNRPVVVLGPGLGQESTICSFVKKIIHTVIKLKLSCVVDADGLNVVAKIKGCKLSDKFVVTPHPGEAARILGISADEVQRDRFEAAALLAKHLGGAVVILKGPGTLVKVDHQGSVNLCGNPYLATAGSGDVLAGIIAGLMAQGLGALEGAKLGVYIHGLAGDEVITKRFGPLIASDLISELPSLVGRFTK